MFDTSRLESGSPAPRERNHSACGPLAGRRWRRWGLSFAVHLLSAALFTTQTWQIVETSRGFRFAPAQAQAQTPAPAPTPQQAAATPATTAPVGYDAVYGGVSTTTTADNTALTITRDADGYNAVAVAYRGASSGTLAFQYAPGNGRTVEADGAATTHLVYSGDYLPMAEFTSAATSQEASQPTYHFPGRGQVTDGSELFAVTDRLGSTRALMAGGAVQARFDYDTLGKPTETDTCTTACPARAYAWRYQSHRYILLASAGDSAGYQPGLQDFKARFYDPGQGRFLNTDLAGASISPYTGMANDWVNKVDLNGQAPVSWLDILALVYYTLMIIETIFFLKNVHPEARGHRVLGIVAQYIAFYVGGLAGTAMQMNIGDGVSPDAFGNAASAIVLAQVPLNTLYNTFANIGGRMPEGTYRVPYAYAAGEHIWPMLGYVLLKSALTFGSAMLFSTMVPHGEIHWLTIGIPLPLADLIINEFSNRFGLQLAVQPHPNNRSPANRPIANQPLAVQPPETNPALFLSGLSSAGFLYFYWIGGFSSEGWHNAGMFRGATRELGGGYEVVRRAAINAGSMGGVELILNFGLALYEQGPTRFAINALQRIVGDKVWRRCCARGAAPLQPLQAPENQQIGGVRPPPGRHNYGDNGDVEALGSGLITSS